MKHFSKLLAGVLDQANQFCRTGQLLDALFCLERELALMPFQGEPLHRRLAPLFRAVPGETALDWLILHTFLLGVAGAPRRAARFFHAYLDTIPNPNPSHFYRLWKRRTKSFDDLFSLALLDAYLSILNLASDYYRVQKVLEYYLGLNPNDYHRQKFLKLQLQRRCPDFGQCLDRVGLLSHCLWRMERPEYSLRLYEALLGRQLDVSPGFVVSFKLKLLRVHEKGIHPWRPLLLCLAATNQETLLNLMLKQLKFL